MIPSSKSDLLAKRFHRKLKAADYCHKLHNDRLKLAYQDTTWKVRAIASLGSKLNTVHNLERERKSVKLRRERESSRKMLPKRRHPSNHSQISQTVSQSVSQRSRISTYQSLYQWATNESKQDFARNL